MTIINIKVRNNWIDCVFEFELNKRDESMRTATLRG